MRPKDAKTTPTQRAYAERVMKIRKPVPLVKNCIRAFFVGGVLCLLGQLIQTGWMRWFGVDKEMAAGPTVATLIALSILATGLGVYDRFAQWAGAGSAVPVTGFANSMASAAIEHRSEGLVLGTAAQMFKLAGPILAFGVTAAFFVALVKALWVAGS
ncbi:stage V sporulation protein AC [Kyrpidia spormannii]|uniref:Stage V sporulation protein AC n=1 Tax=Kyrpidia spormannii TaxID=2055160 RepID=A0A2K8N7V8_9BACL|nr:MULTISPECIES: stage V sporulation protein AC [Kyrpidia]ATY84680.1 stage V sporulation protein AC [Kyrpidia spormannii]MCL6577479.1 stage V sporulation protein AC [Kyrpidia sp.]